MRYVCHVVPSIWVLKFFLFVDVPQNGSVSEFLAHTSGHRLVKSTPPPGVHGLHYRSCHQIAIKNNSCHDTINVLWYISRTAKATASCDISNERAYFSTYISASGILMKTNS